MPTDSNPDQSGTGRNLLTNFTLLALPWLCFQREILEIAKKTVQDPDSARAGEKFTFRELHALMMILDPSGALRNRLGPDFEQRAEGAYNEIVPKVTSAAVHLIEAQEKILDGLFEALNALRKGNNAAQR
jgi:hypothetical protein